MVERCKEAVVCQVADYRSALKSFNHNARRFLVSGFLQGIGGGMLATAFGIFIKTAGMRESVIGDAEAALAFAAAIVSLLGTPLVAKLGYRVLMVAALVVVVGARFGMAAFPVAGVVLGLSLAVGLGDGFMRCIGAAFMSHNSENDERSHLFSVEFLVRMAAGLLGGLAGGLLPTLLRGHVTEVAALQWTVAAGAALVGAGIIPMMALKEKPKAAERPLLAVYRDSFKNFGKWRLVAKLIAPQAFISLGGGMVIPFVSLYLKHSLGVSMGGIGAIMGISSVVTALGVFGTPVIAKRFGLPAGVALLQGLSVPFLAAVSLATSLPVAVGALWIRGALMNMAGPMYNQLSMDGLTEHEKPLVAGWMFFALNMMWLVGSMAGGRLMELSYGLPYVIAVAAYATGAALTFLAWRGRPVGRVAAQGGAAVGVETALAASEAAA